MPEGFSHLGVRPELVEVLTRNGIKEPTPIQSRAIPLLLEGRDVMAQAQTGTGKTLAFLLPILERINVKNPNVQALILTPTRELAIQITAEAKKLAPAVGATILATYGGQDVESQVKRLGRATHLVVATPGRLLDHLRRGTIHLEQVSMLVLDEADQMLHMGFLPDVEQVIAEARAERRTMLCSATMPPEIRALARRYMRSPIEIQIETKQVTLEEIEQLVVEVSDRGKQEALFQKLEEYNPYLALIFCRTKVRADILLNAMLMRGFKVDVLHGDISQAKREQVMRRFREARIQYLVATDVAARGLDVEGVTHVFNYDIPHDPETYIHRIGRTGRAGQTGLAVTFASPRDQIHLAAIEKAVRAKLPRVTVAGRAAPDGAAEARPEREQRPEGVSRRDFARAKAGADGARAGGGRAAGGRAAGARTASSRAAEAQRGAGGRRPAKGPARPGGAPTRTRRGTGQRGS